MKLSLILEAINRAERPLDRYRRDVERAGSAAGAAGDRIGGMSRHMDRAAREARELGRAATTMGDRIAAGARRGASALVALERRMQLSSASMSSLAVGAAGVVGSAIRGGVMTAGALGAGAIAGGLYKIVTAGTQSEVLKTQLVQSRSGDEKAAERDMKWIQDFAANTPYDLAEVTKAFVDARGAGVDPMNGSLMALGDAASALGKTYGEAIEMISDAQNNSFERLAEFQIKASQKNGVATFRYFDRNGKELVKNVKMVGHNVEQAITQILRDKFGGGMDAIAKTTIGKWNNLTDKLSQAAVKVWDGGFGAAVKGQLDRATKALDEAEKNGALDRWSKRTSEGLAQVVSAIGELNWKGFANDVRTVGAAFGKLSENLRAVDYWGNKAAKFLDNAPSAAAQPILDFHEWMKKPLWGGEEKPKPPPTPRPQTTAPARQRQAVPAWSAPQPARAIPQPARAVPAPPQKRAAAPQPQNAKIALHVTTDRGVTVRPTKIQASNVDVDVNTGKLLLAPWV